MLHPRICSLNHNSGFDQSNLSVFFIANTIAQQEQNPYGVPHALRVGTSFDTSSTKIYVLLHFEHKNDVTIIVKRL